MVNLPSQNRSYGIWPILTSLQQDLQNALGQGELLALFFIDLDNFKDVNDFRSHEAGDHLLQMVGKRLVDAVGDRGTVYRFGGDEFIVTAPCLGEPSAQQLARELVISFREPFQYTNALIHLTPSIGLVHSGSERYSSADLIRFADLAMHDSKKRGGNCFTIYHRQLSEGAIDRVLMEQQLRSALEQNRLTLFYQPEVDPTH